MTPQEIEEYIIETYDKILDYIVKMKSKDIEMAYCFNLNDLLCRVGELESSMKYWVDRRKDDNAEPTKNRLCECYNTGEQEYYESIENAYDDDYDDYYDDPNGCTCNCCNH